jgi:phosphoribosyl 1,2-cyclic phosphodiesterase
VQELEIIVLASSSKGNCYIIKNETEAIMLEAGIKISSIRQRLFDNKMELADIKAVAVTHSHGDHATAAKELSNYIPIYASAETLRDCDIDENAVPMIQWQNYRIGKTFTLSSFDVDHDCDGAVGFIVADKEESLLFINDTKLVKWDFSEHDFDHVMIECNHNDDIINLRDSRTVRIAQSHMSLETTKLTLKRMNLKATKGIYLMHLSDGNSDQARMIREVQGVTGLPTYACQKEGGVR